MNDILNKLHEAAASPRAQMDGYLAQGKRIVLCAPVYTPEEIIHAMGFVPMGAWGGDVALNRAKEYCPAFLCSIVQSLLELGLAGAYEGASAIVIPSLCDTLKTVGENWKYAVPSIPFIPMTYPQNRKPAYGVAYTKAGYERVIRDLEKLGGTFSEEKLLASIKVYNRHNAAMRKIDEVLAKHPEITAAQRSDIFKSAFFMTKEEHTELVEALLAKLEAAAPAAEKLPIVISGILTDAPALNAILDEMGLHIVADDVAAQSRQYRTDARVLAELVDQVVDEALVEVFAAEERVAVRGEHFKLLVAVNVGEVDDRDVERAAAKVVHGDLAVAAAALVHAEGERGSGRFVDDTLHFKTGDAAGVLRGLTLGVVEVGGNRDDGFRNGFAEVVFGGLLHLAKDFGADLLRSELLALSFDPSVAVVGAHDRERHQVDVLLDFGVVEAAADEALHGKERVLRIGHSLALGRGADEHFTVVHVGNDGRGRAGAFAVFNNLDVVAFHHGNGRIGGAKVNTNDLRHSGLIL